jgi:hypothetical protein
MDAMMFHKAAGLSIVLVLAFIASAYAQPTGAPAGISPKSAPAPESDAGAEATFDIPVQLGWNFISVPLVQWDTGIAEVLDDHDSGDTTWNDVLWWDASDGADSWKRHYIGWAAINNDLNNINHTMGFQINITGIGDGTLTVNGTLPDKVDMVLFEGQNMVGYPRTNDSAYTVADLKAETTVDGAENSSSVDYSDAHVMKRGTGYWLNATANCTWTIYNNYTLGAAPTISLLSPANNTVFQPGTLITLEIAGSSPYVRTSIDGGAPIDLTPPYEIHTDDWEDGAVTVEVSANDQNGTSVELYRFTVDSTDPEIILNSPSDGALVRVGTVIDMSVNESNLAAVNYTAGPRGGNLTAPFDIDTTGWADGLVRVTVQATDLAGNPATEDYDFTMDGTAPAVTSTVPNNASLGVPVDADLVIQFSEAMDKNATESALSMTPDVGIEELAWNGNANQLTISFSENMTQSTRYRVSLGTAARDVVGNTIDGTFRWEFTTWVDIDGDGLPANQDQDDDGDGYMDPIDQFPNDSGEWLDTDGDGVGDNADLDDDNDSVPDASDAYPLDQYESADSDGDGIGDNEDAFPNDSTETEDSDGDGLGDNEDFLPNLDNNMFYLMAILAPCVTVVIVAMIVTRARERRGRPPAEKPTPKAAEDGTVAVSEKTEKRPPADPMAPPPEE